MSKQLFKGRSKHKPHREAEYIKLKASAPDLPLSIVPNQEDSPTSQSDGILPDLGERYEVLACIGEGATGIVYKVRDKKLGTTLAVKILKDFLACDDLAKKRFEQEVKVACQLTGHGIVAVYGCDKAKDGSPYLVMDFLEGESLAEIIKSEGKLERDRAHNIFVQIAQALEHAHAKGVVHRDLKPSNIIITKAENGLEQVHLVDFGIARVQSGDVRATQTLTKTGDIFGSPLYMSPEQCLGFETDARSDIYSFGCLMYETLTGHPPFAGDNPIQIIVQHLNTKPGAFSNGANVSENLQGVIMHCLEKEQAARYGSIFEVLTDLELVEQGEKPKFCPIEEPINTAAPLDRRIKAALVDGGIKSLFSIMIFGYLSILSTHIDLARPLEGHTNCLSIASIECLAFFVSISMLNSLLVWPLIACVVYGFVFFQENIHSIEFGQVSCTFLVLSVSVFLLNMLYDVCFETSAGKATPGKMLFSIQVADRNFESRSYSKAILRYFSKAITFLILPFLIVWHLVKSGWSKGLSKIHSVLETPFHDRVSGSVVSCISQSSSKEKLSWKQMGAHLLVMAIPYMVLYALYLFQSNMMVPFLNHPIIRLILFSFILWNSFGIFASLCFRSLRGWFFACALPFIIFSMVGPELLYIVQTNLGIAERASDKQAHSYKIHLDQNNSGDTLK